MGTYFCQQICWLSANLPTEMGGISSSRFTDCHQICWKKCWGIFAGRFTVIKSAGRFTDCHQISQQKWGWGISVSRFTDHHQICWPKWGWGISASRFTYSQQIYQQKWGSISSSRFTVVTKSASRFTDSHQICRQIYWLAPNLLADLLTGAKSAGRNGGISTSRISVCHQICWQIYCHQIFQQKMGGHFCQQIYWLSPNLLADLLTVIKSPSRNGWGITAGRLIDWHPICQQIYWLLPNLLAEMGGFCWQICWLSPNLPAEMRGIFLLADLLTHQICQFWAIFSRKAARRMNTEVFHERPIKGKPSQPGHSTSQQDVTW